MKFKIFEKEYVETIVSNLSHKKGLQKKFIQAIKRLDNYIPAPGGTFESRPRWEQNKLKKLTRLESKCFWISHNIIKNK